MMPHSSDREESSAGVPPPEGAVLHVFDHSFPKTDGYAFRSGEILRFLRKIGWRTEHVTSAKQGPTAAGREAAEGFEFYRTQPSPLLRNVPVLNQYGIVSTLRRRLTRIVREARPVLMHVHSPCLNALAAIPVARRLGIPIIYEVRALWEDGAVDAGTAREGDMRYRASRMLETYACRHVDHVVTICEGLRNELAGRGLDAGRITVAPNSVDLNRFSSGDEAPASQPGPAHAARGKTFGFIGTFFPFEGLEVFVRAMPMIVAREPAARFILVGDGPDGARIRALVDQLNLRGVVTVAGRVPHADVVRYYDAIDVLVYPRVSKRVTELVTPLKPLEAMARGAIVVASDVGGHREMVFPGQNGVLFKAGDPASLAEACLRLMNAPHEWDALRLNGRRYVEQFRSWSRNITIYDRLYRQLLTNDTVRPAHR